MPPDIAEFALEGFHARGIESADAYLRCVLNSAMFDEMCAGLEPDHSPYNGKRLSDAPPKQVERTDAGGVG